MGKELHKQSLQFFFLKILIVIFITFLFSCSNKPKISGKIIDQSTKIPIEDAIITLLSTNISDSSDTKGQFSIGDVEIEKYELVVEKKDYYKHKEQIEITKKNPKISLSIELVKINELYGFVFDSDTNKRIPNVRITLYSKNINPSITLKTISDTNNAYYKFVEIPKGEYILQADVNSYDKYSENIVFAKNGVIKERSIPLTKTLRLICKKYEDLLNTHINCYLKIIEDGSSDYSNYQVCIDNVEKYYYLLSKKERILFNNAIDDLSNTYDSLLSMIVQFELFENKVDYISSYEGLKNLLSDAYKSCEINVNSNQKYEMSSIELEKFANNIIDITTISEKNKTIIYYNEFLIGSIIGHYEKFLDNYIPILEESINQIKTEQKMIDYDLKNYAKLKENLESERVILLRGHIMGYDNGSYSNLIDSINEITEKELSFSSQNILLEVNKEKLRSKLSDFRIFKDRFQNLKIILE